MNTKRPITDCPVHVHRLPLYAPMSCSICGKEIQKGERYYKRTGDETHYECGNEIEV